MEALIWSQVSRMQRWNYERLTFMEPHERLLKVVIDGIEFQGEDSLLHFAMCYPPEIPFMEDSRYSSFRPESIMLRNEPRLFGHLAFKFDRTEVLALDRLMKRAEKNDKLRELLLRAMRVAKKGDQTYSFFDHILLRLDFWHLERYAELIPDSVSVSERGSELQDAFSVVVSAVLHLLAFVFQYLIGCVDRGGSKTYSSGSFDFRATYVSLVLFQGAYVWIKFRQAARPGCRKRKASDAQPDTPAGVQVADASDLEGVYRRAVKDKAGTITHYKYEPRFTPPREYVGDGTTRRFNRLNLGEYYTPAEAKIVLQIARFYYDKDGGCVELEDGQYKFPIPPMSEQELELAGEEKRKWVTGKAKQVGKQMYADSQKEKVKQLDKATEAGAHGGHGNGAGSSDPSPSALPMACSSPAMIIAIADEPAIVSEAPSCPSLQLPPYGGAPGGHADDSSGALSGYKDTIDELFHDPGLPNLPAEQSSLVIYQTYYQEFAQILGDPNSPHGEVVIRGIEHVSESQLGPSVSVQQGRDLVDAVAQTIDASGSSVFLQQSDPVLQQLVLCQMKQPEDSPIQFVDLDHRLKVSEIQISKLQQEKERLQQEKEILQLEKQKEKEVFVLEKERLLKENESLKSKVQQVAKSQVAAWTGIMIDTQQRD